MLLYCSNEAHRGFYHHDPISKSNFKHAIELMGELSIADEYFKSKIMKIVSPEQCNGYDCRIYVVMYASKMADDMIKGKYPNSFNLTPA